VGQDLQELILEAGHGQAGVAPNVACSLHHPPPSGLLHPERAVLRDSTETDKTLPQDGKNGLRLRE
jgi:hypothetical protein